MMTKIIREHFPIGLLIIFILFGIGAGATSASVLILPNSENNTAKLPIHNLPASVLILPKSENETVKLLIQNFQDLSDSQQVQREPLFTVYVDSGASDHRNTLPIQGSYTYSSEYVEFIPDFPFSAGVSYRVLVDQTVHKFLKGSGESKKSGTEELMDVSFSIPKQRSSQVTEVTHVYPTGDIIPENLLRFYIYFSSPMRRGFSDQNVKLFDHEGNEVRGALMRFKQELWDPGQQRLTLLLDPGRIKQGVGSNLKFGPALQEGHTFRLVIERDFQDAEGRKLKQSFEKRFTVGPPLRTAPNPDQWVIHPPQANSHDALVIEFLRPFDHALAKRLIQVIAPSGKTITGTIELEQAETVWKFTPIEEWEIGAYSIQIDTTLEDVAANNLQGLLDRDLNDSTNDETVSDYVELSFDIK